MYKVKLDSFEGPLDLLLFFIKRDELDIYDIPIAYITKEFMSYLHLLEKLDLEVAGDFILMAATLMQIKVKMLLPKEINEKGEEIDPRQDLVDALLEYKRYKEMSDELSFMESGQRKISYRGNYSADEKEAPQDMDALLKNISIYDLIKAFQKAMMEKPKEPIHEIKRFNVTIEEQIQYIMAKLEHKEFINFIELAEFMTEKLRIIVTFIALLELVKMEKIGLRESETFNQFEIYRIEEING